MTLRPASVALVAALSSGRGDAPTYCGRCGKLATRVGLHVRRCGPLCDGCDPPEGVTLEDLSYAPAWRALVAATKEGP